MRKHLTYANVVATLCLVLILGGGAAYAANTVFSTDIVDGEVKVADIGTGAVRTGEIANRQVTQADLKPAEPWHEVGSAGEPPFLSTNIVFPGPLDWANWDAATHNSAGFYRDPYGRVHLKGLVRASGTEGPDQGIDDIFRLPLGYRPAKEIEFATSSEGAFARLDVKPTGEVSADPPYNYGSLYLDNISFRCAPSGSNGCP